MRKLTITVSDEVYDGLYAKVGPRHISRFLDALARPHVVDAELDADYRDMAADADRETEAYPGHRAGARRTSPAAVR